MDNKNNLAGTIQYTGEDYELLEGEGCCFHYSGNSINLNLNLVEIIKEVEHFNTFNERLIEINGRKALRFFSIKGYADFWVEDEILIPLHSIMYSNILISGPTIGTIQEEDEEVAHKKLIDYVLLEKYINDEEISKKYNIYNKIVNSIEIY